MASTVAVNHLPSGIGSSILSLGTLHTTEDVCFMFVDN